MGRALCLEDAGVFYNINLNQRYLKLGRVSRDDFHKVMSPAECIKSYEQENAQKLTHNATER